MIKVVAYVTDVKDDKVYIADSEGESILSSDVDELLNFLNEPYPEYLCIKVFWDIDTALSPIIRLLGVTACKELASPSHEYAGLFYITGKLFRIERDNRMSFFYHLSQYFPEEDEQTDPEVIWGMADDVLKAFHDMGLNPKKLTSPIAIYESEVLSHMDIPTIANLKDDDKRRLDMEQLIEFAEKCVGFPDNLHFWIQAYKVGHFELGSVFEFDRRAAFPSQAMKLRNLKNAQYAKSPYIQPDADWGFMKGEVTIYPDVKVSPIFDLNGNQPTGTFPAYITLQDLRFIQKWRIGTFKHEIGYYIKFTKNVYPMEIPLQRLFNQRGQGTVRDMLAKRISTAFSFGKFLERHADGAVGNYYNPIYASMVVSTNNLEVAEFIYKNNFQDTLIHVSVDGLASTKDAVKINDQKKVGMGQWRFSGVGAMLVLSSGRIYHGDKKPQGLNYNQIMALIQEHPRETFYTANLFRRQTLEESIQLNDLKGVGKLKSTNSSFDLGLIRTDTGRVFDKFPHTGHELLNNTYDSKPLNYPYSV